MTRAIKAVTLTDTQLRMLDIGAPVIVACETLTGETVAVRLQTGTLADHLPAGAVSADAAAAGDAGGDAPGDAAGDAQPVGWRAHGAYVAVMPAGIDYGS